ncbi:MAG: NAD(P)-dependent oxidoreductase [Candidatus Omnitrophica bacterium]|nr:NAD(P)-dependent oxidoreductase [Candidatus Omnitrophota bacterium]
MPKVLQIMNAKNVLITGSTGFIGRHLVAELAKTKGYNIFCLVRNPFKVKFLAKLGVKFIYADITQSSSLEKILDYKIDIIFHCAGYVNNKNRDLLYKINVLGTKNICRLAKKLDIERMVYLSSVSVVSGNPLVPLCEDLPYKATNIYGESKIEAEKKVIDYRKKGLRSVILRPCMVYGEGEPHMLGLLLFLLKFRLLPLINGGRNKLHLVYVKNVVEAMLFSLNNDKFLQGTFFIADNEVLTVKDIFTILAAAINSSPPWDIPVILNHFFLNIPFVGKKLKFFLKDRIYSIEKIKSLNFNPIYPAQESLKNSVIKKM